MNYDIEYDRLRQTVEARLASEVGDWSDLPDKLSEAMAYSLMAGGKRLRPVLMLAAGQMCGIGIEEVAPYACALEMIHTYSLIHDDLPGMDDDDYRRGRPSNHKVFGVGMGILAGDGLLNAAYELMLKNIAQNNFDPNRVRAASIIAEAAGIRGMIAGQCVDLNMEGVESNAETLNYIHTNKTGRMITAATLVGGQLAGVDGEKLNALKVYGECIGLAFQITDDILDIESTSEELGKPVGSDEKNEKLTYPKLYGLDNAKIRARELVEQASDALGIFGGDKEFLVETAKRITARKK